MLPSLYHKSQTASYISQSNERLNKIIKKVLNDKRFMREANLDNSDKTAPLLLKRYCNIMELIPGVLMLWIIIGLHCGLV